MLDWNLLLEKVKNSANYLMIDPSRTRYFTAMNKAKILLSGVDISKRNTEMKHLKQMDALLLLWENVQIIYDITSRENRSCWQFQRQYFWKELGRCDF